MRAVIIDDFGTTPTLAEVAPPVPGPGEVLVRVRATSLNGFDRAVIYGALKDMMEHKFPITLGKDFAGTIKAVGEGVDHAVGERVFGVVMKPVISVGSFAEYVVVGAGYGLATIPEGVDFPRAGALGLAGTAAVDLLGAIALKAGETLLVSGATGGVGAYAIQLATALGATVIATAMPGAETEFVHSMGAAHAVDYTSDLAAEVRAVASDGVSTALHLAGDPAVLVGLLVPGGRIASVLGFSQEQAGGADITVTSVVANPEAATLERLANAVNDGELRVPISGTYALADIAQAFDIFDAGTLGKISVTVD